MSYGVSKDGVVRRCRRCGHEDDLPPTLPDGMDPGRALDDKPSRVCGAYGSELAGWPLPVLTVAVLIGVGVVAALVAGR